MVSPTRVRHFLHRNACSLDYPYVREQQHIANLAASWVALEDVQKTAAHWNTSVAATCLKSCYSSIGGNGSITLEPTSHRQAWDFVEYLQTQMDKLGIKPVYFCRRKDV